MAHYLAEQIKLAEKAPAKEKEKLEKECFETIIKLWEHRSDIPWKKPLQSYDDIFGLLDCLATQKNAYSRFIQEKELENGDTKGQWIKLSSSITSAASTLIRWCLANASVHAEREDVWLKDKIPALFSDSKDFEIIRIIVNDSHKLLSEEEKYEKYRKEELEDIRKNLDWFIDVTEKMKKEIDKKLC